ncbi:MAG: KamA family radical SAM protein [Oligoflexia bacterium]|nr:KamA family radical SAM protein [Oligoflexia bacterium]
MKFDFLSTKKASAYEAIDSHQWYQWTWQLQHRLTQKEDFEKVFNLSSDEIKGFEQLKSIFKVSTTPYYASIAAQIEESNSVAKKNQSNFMNPLKRIMLPHVLEVEAGEQQMLDPLAEETHSHGQNLIHRYSDRVLFLVTDTCSVYCRFCTRKRFTGQDEGFINSNEYQKALSYIRSHPGIREVIFSGGDPLTLSNSLLDRVLSDIRSIEHIEIIRIGSRMPVVCPMRIDEDLCKIMRRYAPVYMMSHFSHPKELTLEARQALTLLVDHGIPVLNQMVLLNGVNNNAAIIQALNRRLLYLRVKPYYMFQCDPSEGTDHLRTTVESSEEIMREMWGHLSGLAMPTLSLDIPSGGGKTTLVPNFMVSASKGVREFVGWDSRKGIYRDPKVEMLKPSDVGDYEHEWEELKNAKNNLSIDHQMGLPIEAVK